MSAVALQATSMELSIRQAVLSDAEAISKLGRRVFTATFGHSLEPHDLRAYLDEAYSICAITKDLQTNANDLIIAVDSNDSILGFAYLTRGATEPCLANVEEKVQLKRLYVDVSSHGKGVGKLLYLRAQEMAVEQGFKHIWLSVWEENKKAINMYGKWGYCQVGDYDFAIGDIVQKDYIMLKSLG